MEGLNELEASLSLYKNVHHQTGPVIQKMLRFKAEMAMAKNELGAIYYLTESHVPSLQFQDILLREKNSLEQNFVRRSCANSAISINIHKMLDRLYEMPQEWTIIQLTPQFDVLENLEYDINRNHTVALHLTVFHCGKKQVKPFCIGIDAPIDAVSGERVELYQEIHSIREDSRSLLVGNKVAKDKVFSTISAKEEYYNKRKAIDQRLKAIVKDLQNIYLREWRVFFLGKYQNDSFNVKIQKRIQLFIKSKGLKDVDEKTQTIIQYLIKGFHFLHVREIISAANYLFPGDINLQNSLKQFIKNISDELDPANAKKHPVILILDDVLDFYPWEMMDVFLNESVSRVPSLLTAYSLFKEHQSSIKNGFKIITDPTRGRFLLNADKNLDTMENRLSSFYKYWTPTWTGIRGCKPTEEEFKELLLSGTIFTYSGHGNGCHHLSMHQIQKMKIDAVVFLFGCSSSRLIKLGPHVEMYGTYQMYLTASSPCVVGMLWEVTDLETDVFTTNFLSSWIPATGDKNWAALDHSKWKKGAIVDFSEQEIDAPKAKHECELLKALSLIKNSSKLTYYLTTAAVVARGIPVKIDVSN